MVVLLGCFLLALLILLLLKIFDRFFSVPPNPNPSPSLIPITHHREECLSQLEMRVKKVTENCTECALCLEGFTDDDGGDSEANKKEKIAVWVLPQCGHKFNSMSAALLLGLVFAALNLRALSAAVR